MHRIRFPVRRNANRNQPRGAYVVEMAFVLPVFLVFIFLIYEFGHAYMVLHSIQGAAKIGAREGAIEGSTNSSVTTLITDTLSGSFDTSKVSISIKDASPYDDTSIDPSTITYASLSNLNLSNATARQLFLIRVEVNYDEVTIVPSVWRHIVGQTFWAQSVMRHE